MDATPRYFDELASVLRAVQVTRGDGVAMTLDQGLDETITLITACAAAGRKVIFIGNGGSAAIASHQAVDCWKNGGIRALVYVEIATAGACNHRCTFCAVDYIGYKTRTLERDRLIRRVTEMAERGVRSIMYAGEGEPLLHKHIGEIIVETQKVGIDVALTTNAVALNEKVVHEALGSLTWIKVSVNAGTRETYSKVHQTKADDFDRVFRNLAKAVEVKQANLSLLGLVLLVFPSWRNLVIKHLIKRPWSKSYFVMYYLAKAYLIGTKIYPMKYSARHILRTIKESFFSELLKHSREEGERFYQKRKGLNSPPSEVLGGPWQS